MNNPSKFYFKNLIFVVSFFCLGFCLSESAFAQKVRLRAQLTPTCTGSANSKFADIYADGNQNKHGDSNRHGDIHTQRNVHPDIHANSDLHAVCNLYSDGITDYDQRNSHVRKCGRSAEIYF